MPEKADPVSALRLTLRGQIDKVIAAIDDPEHYIEVDRRYRAGWIDALRAVRDDPAIAAADAALSGEAPDRDGETLTDWTRRYFERLDHIRATNDPDEQAQYGAGVELAEREIRARLRSPSLEGARHPEPYTVVETLQSPDTPPSDLHLRGARHPEAGELP